MVGLLGLIIERDIHRDVITLTQTRLIDCILQILNMEEYTIKFTSLDKDMLYKNLKGASYKLGTIVQW